MRGETYQSYKGILSMGSVCAMLARTGIYPIPQRKRLKAGNAGRTTGAPALPTKVEILRTLNRPKRRFVLIECKLQASDVGSLPVTS